MQTSNAQLPGGVQTATAPLLYRGLGPNPEFDPSCFRQARLMELGVPAALATGAADHVSAQYEFIPTAHVVRLLEDQGWMPVSAKQSYCRKPERRAFAKHMINFRNPNFASLTRSVGDIIPQLVLTNSHDGQSSFGFHAGLFRLVCLNGMMVKQGDGFGSISIRHRGFKSEDVIEASYRIIDSIPKIASSVKEFQEVLLSQDQMEAFAFKALAMKYDEPKKAPIHATQLLMTRRSEDRPTDLFTVMNVIQENLLRGGLKGVYAKTREDGTEYRRNATTRAIRGVVETVRVNHELWQIADQIRNKHFAN